MEARELCARVEEDRLRPLDERAAVVWPELVSLRCAELSSLEAECLTSASSIVPRHSPDSASFIMM